MQPILGGWKTIRHKDLGTVNVSIKEGECCSHYMRDIQFLSDIYFEEKYVYLRYTYSLTSGPGKERYVYRIPIEEGLEFLKKVIK